MKIQCSVCEVAEANVLCCADEAALCWGCDKKVHAANKLASKHQRVLLSSSSSQMPKCDICQSSVKVVRVKGSVVVTGHNLTTDQSEANTLIGAVCGKEMASMKFDIEKFSGKSDFNLWRIKMKAMLVQNGLGQALKGESELPTTLSDIQKADILEKAHSAIILCLGDKALRQVSKEKSAADVWLKLEYLYMTKSLANRLLP